MYRRNRGFAIVVATAVLAIALVLAVTMTIDSARKLGMVRYTASDVNATLMARSGLDHGLVELAADLTGYDGTPITELAPRHVYLVDTPERSNNQVELVSTGVADGIARQIRVKIGLDSGVSGVFDKAIYAGNVPPDPEDQDNLPPQNLAYSLDFGGVGDQSDLVTGDVYSGNDVKVEQDAVVSPAVEETFTDSNGNGLYDRGDYLNLDINGNGQFDPDVAEAFVDENGNGEYDEGEEYDDVNENGQYDGREGFIDFDNDGVFDLPEPFNDSNGNDRFDFGIEAVGDVDYANAPGVEGGDAVLRPPDLAASDYPNSSDIDVAERFASISSGILPESDAAHIFIKNPRDGRQDIVDQTFNLNGTVVNPDDYFLEDPYEHVNLGSKTTAENATRISLAGGPAGKEEDGNHKVYFIDGNLFLHNRHTYSFKIQDAENTGIGVTFVVRGNIVLSDNFYYRNINKDQVAFIALRREDDPKGEISGNIYIGDADFGTIAHLESLLYAENNFYDNNLDEEESKYFEIYGNMTAGNQVLINRDYIIPGHYEWRFVNGEWEQVWIAEQQRHSAMAVIFDERYVDGPNGRERIAPGLPLGPRRDFSVSMRLASIQYVGRVDVPQEYYDMYGY